MLRRRRSVDTRKSLTNGSLERDRLGRVAMRVLSPRTLALALHPLAKRATFVAAENLLKTGFVPQVCGSLKGRTHCAAWGAGPSWAAANGYRLCESGRVIFLGRGQGRAGMRFELFRYSVVERPGWKCNR